MFFSLAEEALKEEIELRCTLSDANPDLVACYQAVGEMPSVLIERVELMRNDKKSFDQIKAINPWRPRTSEIEPSTPASIRLEVAARFYYLNRTCFNGLWRENASGQFNVPFGSRPLPNGVADAGAIYNANRLLRAMRTDVHHVSWNASPIYNDAGAFVYMDPPYLPETASGFDSYTSGSFGLSDYRDIAKYMASTRSKAMLSSADHPAIRELFADFTIHNLSSRRSVAASSAARGSVNELAVTNY